MNNENVILTAHEIGVDHGIGFIQKDDINAFYTFKKRITDMDGRVIEVLIESHGWEIRNTGEI